MKGRLLADLGHHLRELERFGVFQREIAHTKTCVRPEMIIQYGTRILEQIFHYFLIVKNNND